MAEPDNDKGAISKVSYTAVSVAIWGATGIPVPPAVVRSATKAVETLIGAAVDIPRALLESKAQSIRADSRASAAVTAAAAELAARQLAADPEMAKRALERFGAKIVRQQANTEATMRLAIAELSANPPTDSSVPEVSDDWMAKFARVAEDVSDADLRRYFAKVLAGEISRPGSFSPLTLSLLSNLTKDMATSFAELANLAISVIGTPIVLSDPYGDPNNDGLAKLGFPYMRLKEIEEVGLIQSDFAQYLQLQCAASALPGLVRATLSGHALPVNAKVQPTTQVQMRLRGVRFTRAGAEACRLIEPIDNGAHFERVAAFLSGQASVKPDVAAQ